jgi:hypothetical protein
MPPTYSVLTEAISHAFDGQPVFPTRFGGCGPERILRGALNISLIFIGVGLPNDHIRVPNEQVAFSLLYRGAETAALLWHGFARIGPPRPVAS